jgi:hypothetical protein
MRRLASAAALFAALLAATPAMATEYGRPGWGFVPSWHHRPPPPPRYWHRPHQQGPSWHGWREDRRRHHWREHRYARGPRDAWRPRDRW